MNGIDDPAYESVLHSMGLDPARFLDALYECRFPSSLLPKLPWAEGESGESCGDQMAEVLADGSSEAIARASGSSWWKLGVPNAWVAVVYAAATSVDPDGERGSALRMALRCSGWTNELAFIDVLVAHFVRDGRLDLLADLTDSAYSMQRRVIAQMPLAGLGPDAAVAFLGETQHIRDLVARQIKYGGEAADAWARILDGAWAPRGLARSLFLQGLREGPNVPYLMVGARNGGVDMDDITDKRRLIGMADLRGRDVEFVALLPPESLPEIAVCARSVGNTPLFEAIDAHISRNRASARLKGRVRL